MPVTFAPFHYLTVLQDAIVDGQPVEPRIQVMVIVLAISLFAVSFPGVSKSIPFLRIPHIVFFVGKHFGTGVILATAFIHLLQDSFEALQKRQVKEHFDNIGKYTGLIILTSLLTIFLIEYLSTSYVDHLHAEPSLPPTPISSLSPSPQRSRRPTLKSSRPPALAQATISISQAPVLSRAPSQQSDNNAVQMPRTDENTPLLRPPRTQSVPHVSQPHAHSHAHHAHLPAIVPQDTAAVIPIEVLTNSPRIIKMRGCTCVVGHACACPASALDTSLSKDTSAHDCSRSRSNLRVSTTAPGSPVLGLSEMDEEETMGSKSGREREREVKPRVGRRRQVIGLLVLQLGIMIHSIVIGLTLAITTGADFTSLTTAVIFHQLFEGLSLGIRIAALPPPPSDMGDEESLSARGYKPESDSERGFVKNLMTAIRGEHGEGWLKFVLAILFAITTPAGMGLGMVVFKVGKRKEGIELARMYLIQGVMSAISAGMLIYASTVEMIAGDFVFGDVEGHSHHGHGHSHELPSMEDGERASTTRAKSKSRSRDSHEMNDAAADTMAEEIDEENEDVPERDENHYHHHHHHHHHHRHHHHYHHHGKIGKKVLAVVSLLAGVGGMVLVGLGE